MKMISRQNLHTHCTYCDGNNTLQELAEKAIMQGLDSIGFSSHSYTGLAFDGSAIKKEDIGKYLSDIDALKEQYSGRLRIYKGFEYDSRGIAAADEDLDYSIGSVHFFQYKNRYFSVDFKIEEQLQAEEYFGSAKALAVNYFEELIRFSYTSDFDIIGHFDLLTKFTEKGGIRFEEMPWYKDMALEALEAAASSGKLFEMNTGAMARGYRSAPYPSLFLLKRLNDIGARMVLTSDCHSMEYLTYRFAECEELLREAGFKELYELRDDGFVPYSI